MEFFWDTLCEVGEAWLIIGGIILMVVYTEYKNNKGEKND